MRRLSSDISVPLRADGPGPTEWKRLFKMQNVRQWVVLLSATATLSLLVAWHSIEISHINDDMSGYSLFQGIPTTAQVVLLPRDYKVGDYCA
jgi:hypothetical protein